MAKVEFKLVNTPRVDRFETQISLMLNEGWELHGTPFISGTGTMVQSLVRHTEEAPKRGRPSAKTSS